MDRPHILMMGPYQQRDMDLMAQSYTMHHYWEAADKAAMLKSLGPYIRAVATRGDLGATQALMTALPNLEIISCFGVGVDGIDLKAAAARGIAVTNTPDVLTDDVADLALGLMLSVARLMPQGDRLVRAGTWPEAGLPLVTRMCGKRLGIFGLGRIGAAIAKRAAGFDMHISYHNRRQRNDVTYDYEDNLVALAAKVDFLVVAVSGGDGTKELVSAETLAALGPDGYFINVARGSVVNEEALLNALQSRAIKGAGLDVFLNEPNIDPRFLTLDNVVLQPHHGSGTAETRMAMGQLVRDNLSAHFAGRALISKVEDMSL